MSFLSVLLPEIRQEIYTHLLTSPTGTITLTPTSTPLPPTSTTDTIPPIPASQWDSPLPIYTRAPLPALRCKLSAGVSLAFLRTSKTIFQEASPLTALWRNNIFSLSPSFDIARTPLKVAANVQMLRLDMMFAGVEWRSAGQGGWRLEREFLHLERHWGQLRSLTLEAWPVGQFIGEDIPSVHDMFRFCIMERGGGEKYFGDLEALKWAAAHLGHLERTIVVDSGVEEDFYQGVPGRGFNRGDGDPDQVLADWAEAFGGSLVFDGVTCYKDGALVRPAFVPERWERGIKRRYYRKDVDVWSWAQMREDYIQDEAEEYAREIGQAYAAAGLEGVSELLGYTVLRADDEALEDFKRLHCKYKSVDRAPAEWLEIQ